MINSNTTSPDWPSQPPTASGRAELSRTGTYNPKTGTQNS